MSTKHFDAVGSLSDVDKTIENIMDRPCSQWGGY